MELEVYWCKCKGKVWCELFRVDYDHKNLQGVEGVYILWYEMQEREIIKVGKGLISEELKRDAADLSIQAFQKYRPKATWAELEPEEIDGVLAYLNIKLKPKIAGEQGDRNNPIEVNLPWD